MLKIKSHVLYYEGEGGEVLTGLEIINPFLSSCLWKFHSYCPYDCPPKKTTHFLTPHCNFVLKRMLLVKHLPQGLCSYPREIILWQDQPLLNWKISQPSCQHLLAESYCSLLKALRTHSVLSLRACSDESGIYWNSSSGLYNFRGHVADHIFEAPPVKIKTVCEERYHSWEQKHSESLPPPMCCLPVWFVQYNW